ncbi:unnamed protein product [Mycena citricolor]|uniref:Uncharacterized protein n=1 Tax=Mycena citricolor TaxID=2018698 RepID=A0AAD2GTD7_9AGAR|nr:unnamed protein product [Mycena citricolor]
MITFVSPRYRQCIDASAGTLSGLDGAPAGQKDQGSSATPPRPRCPQPYDAVHGRCCCAHDLSGSGRVTGSAGAHIRPCWHIVQVAKVTSLSALEGAVNGGLTPGREISLLDCCPQLGHTCVAHYTYRTQG